MRTKIFFGLFFSFIFCTSLLAQQEKKAVVESLLQKMIGKWEMDLEKSDFEGIDRIKTITNDYRATEFGTGVEVDIRVEAKDENNSNIEMLTKRILAYDEESEELLSFTYNNMGSVTYIKVQVIDEQTFRVEEIRPGVKFISVIKLSSKTMELLTEEYDQQGQKIKETTGIMRRGE